MPARPNCTPPPSAAEAAAFIDTLTDPKAAAATTPTWASAA